MDDAVNKSCVGVNETELGLPAASWKAVCIC